MQVGEGKSTRVEAKRATGAAPAMRPHEVSRFVRDDGRWYYMDGEFPTR